MTDTRNSADYNEGHIQLAKLAKKEDDTTYRVPFGTHLPTCLHCVVYDSNTVSVMEDSESANGTCEAVCMCVSIPPYITTAPATQLANQLASSGSKNQVLILKGEHTGIHAL